VNKVVQQGFGDCEWWWWWWWCELWSEVKWSEVPGHLQCCWFWCRRANRQRRQTERTERYIERRCICICICR